MALALVLIGPLAAFRAPPALAEETNQPAEAPSAFPELKKQQEKLTLETGIAEMQLKKDLAQLSAEKQRLELENALAQQKLQAENADLQAQLDKLTKQLALRDAEQKAKLDAELAETRRKVERLRADNDLATAELAAAMRGLTQREQDLKVKIADLQAQRSELDLQAARTSAEITQREQELRVRSAELQLQRTEFDIQVAKLNADLDLRDKKDLWKNRVNRDIEYTREPFKDGVLTISDRRIALDDVITSETAGYIVERIDYFNNQSQEYPIFIVIDRSPGGSVMAGYKILKAMEGSPAPVYVVVKSYAASMAAGITTLARRSFAYPNAILLHHQILSGSFGNLTEQMEQVKELQEWWRRLATPVARKMGITTDEFIKRMYENRSTGDWQEFADSARKIKWVDEIAETIREESYIKNPDAPAGLAPPPKSPPALTEQTDDDGRRFVLLPRLDPVDCYYLYNPDNYYRLE
jgi:ATP-dependent Clp protease protease subunit